MMKFRNALRTLSMASAASAALAASTLAQAAFTPPPFPRIGGVQNAAPFDYNDPSYQAALARQSLTILNFWPGLHPGGQSIQSVVRSIKAINPNALIFLYVNADAQSTNPAGSADASLIEKLNAMHWWLTGSTATALVSSFFGHGDYTINNSPYTRKDAGGEDSIDWITQWYVEHYFDAAPDIDGFFMDNVFAAPRVAGDWYGDGEVLQPSSPQAQAAIQAGYERYFARARALMPGKYQIGNIATWAVGGAAIPAGYTHMADGGVMEQLIGESYSPENVGGWQQMMQQYYADMAALNAPKLAIFNQWGSPTDYQAFRYGFASCLMDDGYYSFTSSASGYTGVVWFDEYNAKLGEPTVPPPTHPWQHGVWRRDFTNGIALVNPKGNGPQTVALGGTFVKIRGTQDPSVDNGATVTSVTLQNRDGVILLRPAPLIQPDAPAQLSIGAG
jgi:hypothetical protein